MIRIEQIRELENKVHAAITRINSLSDENNRLKESLRSYETRIDDLQEQVAAFKNDQDEIEAGIVAALEQLDALEDGVGEAASPDDEDAASAAAQEPGPGVEGRRATTKPEKQPRPTPDKANTESRTTPKAVEEPETILGDEEEDPELDIF